MKIEALLPYLLPDVPGAPDITARQALLLTAIEFCVKTHAWEEIQDPIPLEDGVNEYEIDLDPGVRVAAVKSVWMQDRQLTPKTMEEISLLIPNWQAAQSSIPMFYSAPADLDYIRVYPIPLQPGDGKLTIRAAFAPTLQGSSIPDSIVNRYLEVLIAGAKARLMAAPGKSWSNPQLAAYHQQKFDEGVNSARIDVMHDKVQGSVRVKPVRFGF